MSEPLEPENLEIVPKKCMATADWVAFWSKQGGRAYLCIHGSLHSMGIWISGFDVCYDFTRYSLMT